MSISRREIIALGAAAGALSALSPISSARTIESSAEVQSASPMPTQVATDRPDTPQNGGIKAYDMRSGLKPGRLTLAMWDQAYALRHVPGESFEDYDRVLDETVERGYNTVRIDPMPQWVNLRDPGRVLDWGDPNALGLEQGCKRARGCMDNRVCREAPEASIGPRWYLDISDGVDAATSFFVRSHRPS